MKVLAMYLPQFHRVKENDEWWGEGFTEWTTVNNAEKLYAEHEQPRKPWKEYNLLEKETMLWQERLMKEYGVDGFCFYHYYFENGKKILEKPLENLLEWKDIDIPFCFYWANESWVRSWSKLKGGNPWSEIYDKSKREENDGVLLRQNYGEEKAWRAHFEYLLPFFKDSRYIKYEGHPIFIIYKPEDIICLKPMKDCWNSLMKANGLESIYFIGKDSLNENLDATLLHQPQRARRQQGINAYENEYGIGAIIDYENTWSTILSEEIGTDKKSYLGGFVGYDDTPRRGKSGTVYQGATPEKFKEAMIRLLVKAEINKSEMIFINAWNEWGEGMYLEPDEKWGTQFLQALKEARIYFEENKNVLIACVKDNITGGNQTKNSNLLEYQIDKYRGYWQILDKWVKLSLQGRRVSDFFVQKRYQSIAIYGLGMLGENLVQDMERNGLQVSFAIDQNPYKGRQYDFSVYTIEDEWGEEHADVLVVTVDYSFDVIRERLEEKNRNLKIISIREILDEFD